MSTNIKVIRFTVITAFILAIVTYGISLNISYGWYELKWMSNNFLLTVFGGAFASMLVVLSCEFQKYLQNKKDTQRMIIKHVGHVYGCLQGIKNSLMRQQLNPSEEVLNSLLTSPSDWLKQELNTIREMDYTTIFQNDRFSKEFVPLRKYLCNELYMFSINCVNLALAINQDKIENLKKYGHEGVITATSPYTGATISKLSEKIDPFTEQIDLFMQFVDAESGGKFNWPLRRLATEFASNKEFDDLELFLSKDTPQTSQN